jgi:HSP20 family protein
MTLPILRGAGLPMRRGDHHLRDTGRDAAALTALSPLNPWREIDEMSRWFDELMSRSFGVSPYGGRIGAAASNAGAPAVDLYESPEELRLFAYAPGAKADAFDITVTGDALTIKGERQPLIEGENWTGYGSGVARAQGAFEASYGLPCAVDASQVSACYHEGVLEIRLPKAEPAKVKTVKVNVKAD